MSEVSSRELTEWAALYQAETAERAEADARTRRPEGT